MFNKMKTYRNEQYGFEIDTPEDWSISSGKMPLWFSVPHTLKFGWSPSVTVQFVGTNESCNINVETMTPELPPDVTELLFTLEAQDMEYVNCEFGRITIEDKRHTWTRYEHAGKVWSKKYLIVGGGQGYAITAACNNRSLFAQREKVWDEVALSFRLLLPIDNSVAEFNNSSRAYRTISQFRETLEMRVERRARNLSYGRACEAIEDNRYSDARIWLEKCRDEFLEDNIETQVFILKKLVSVCEKLGDKKAILRYRKEIKRINPSDYVNRKNLVELLVGYGYRKEAMDEVEELIALDPNNNSFQELKASLENNKRPNHRLRFVLSIVYFLFVDVNVLVGGIILKAPWLAGFLCLPAAHYLNLSGRWVGLTRKKSNWLTVVFSLSTLALLVLKADMNIILFFLFFPLIFPILKDNALKD
ncbi:MAG: tetratricopeptide repeat protein [Deltaproteobacteria bacterium]|nr:tetratricopeptide repeat protein [Deltaproteobacteria bacterium]